MDVRRTVDAPLSAVWDVLVDTTTWPTWGPSITEVESSTERIAVGTTGRVRTVVGLWLPFEVTEVVASHSWRWKVAGIPATGHRVEPVDEDTTAIVFELPALAAPYAGVCWAAAGRVRRVANDRLVRERTAVTTLAV